MCARTPTSQARGSMPSPCVNRTDANIVALKGRANAAIWTNASHNTASFCSAQRRRTSPNDLDPTTHTITHMSSRPFAG